MRRYANDFATIVSEQLSKDETLSAVVRADAEGFFSRVRQVLDVSFVWMSRKLRELPIDRVGTATENHVKKEVERLIRIPSETVATRLTVDDWRRTNVDLVTKMTREQLDKIAAVLDEYNGQNPFEIAKQLQKELDVTKSRAELIARDQVLKLNADLTEAAHKQAGITKYRWSSSQDSSVRPFHKALEGRVFSYDDPPVVNKQGDRQNPGHDYECRCVAIPILDELEGTEPEQLEETSRVSEVIAKPEQAAVLGRASGDLDLPTEIAPLGRIEEGVHVKEISDATASSKVGRKQRDLVTSALNVDELAVLARDPLSRLELHKDGDLLDAVGVYHHTQGRPELGGRMGIVVNRKNKVSYGSSFEPGSSLSMSDTAKTADEAVKTTISHEFGHRLHMRSPDEIKALVDSAYASGKAITDYASSDVYEYFAESYACYRTRPEALLKHDPIGYAMVRRVCKYYGIR